jgi:4-hydroxyphenylpyruvate dioxygenase
MSSKVRTLSNPMGTDGFEFIEFASERPNELAKLFTMLGFTAIAKHISKQVTLYRQGSIYFILNAENEGHAAQFSEIHGPCVCAMSFRVDDAEKAYAQALSNGAKAYCSNNHYLEHDIPAIYGVGNSLLYFVDLYASKTIYDVDFKPIPGANFNDEGAGLLSIDHVTHNFYQGQLDCWTDFYEKLFNFREIQFFDIQRTNTRLRSRTLCSPCGKIRIPLIEAFQEEYNGEGIQHIALTTLNIYETVNKLKQNGVKFMGTPDVYYKMIDKRLPDHGENTQMMKENRILIDDGSSQDGGILLHVFTNTVIGPIIFEIIQHKTQTLVESIEIDQIQQSVVGK